MRRKVNGDSIEPHNYSYSVVGYRLKLENNNFEKIDWNNIMQAIEKISTVYLYFLKLLAMVAAVSIVFVVLSVSADVLLRELFGYSTDWVIEYNERSMILLLMLGMPWLVHKKGHVSIDILVANTRESLRDLVERASAMLVAMFCLVIAYISGKVFYADLLSGMLTPGFSPIPRYLLTSVFFLGFLLTSIEYLRIVAFGYALRKNDDITL